MALCVAMLDIDGLKQLNDTRGHHAGDQLLKQNAAAWSSVLRPVDLLARYGGDEFAAILTGCRLADGQKLVQRPQDVHSLMAESDARLYAAKAPRANVVIAVADAKV